MLGARVEAGVRLMPGTRIGKGRDQERESGG